MRHDAANTIKGLRDALLRIADRAEDWSSVDVRAAVADALGMTVGELEAKLEE